MSSVRSDFISAVKYFDTLSEHWDQLKMVGNETSEVPSKSYRAQEIAEVFAGNYDMVPKSEPEDTTGVLSMSIVDREAFAELPTTRQRQVNHFLKTQRQNLIKKTIAATQLVVDVLERSSEREFATAFKKFNTGYYSKSSQQINSLFKNIKAYQSNFNINNFMACADLIVHGYLPLLRNYKNSNNYDHQLVSNMSIDDKLALVAVTTHLKARKPKRTVVVKGGAVEIPVPVTQVVEKIETVYVDRYIPESTKYETESYEGVVDFEPMTGGVLSSDAYVNQIHSLQNKFNAEYVKAYKALIDRLDQIDLETLKSEQPTSMINVIRTLEMVMISSGKTLLYISGLTPKKDINKTYIEECKKCRTLIQNIGLFKGVVDVLSEIINACTKVANDMKELKNKYMVEYKSASDIFKGNKKFEQELPRVDFTREIIVRKNDVLNKLYSALSSVKNLSFENTLTENILKSYIADASTRKEAIDNHFNNYINSVKYSMSVIPVSRDVAYIRQFADMKTTLINQARTAYHWLNTHLDKFLVDKRLEQLGNKPLNAETLQNIADAYVNFNKYYKVTWKSIADKYKRFCDLESITSFFKLFKLAKQTFEEVDAFVFLEKMYRALGIDIDNFPEFKSKLIDYLCVNMIWFDIYKEEESKYYLANVNELKEQVNENFDSKYDMVNSAYQKLNEILSLSELSQHFKEADQYTQYGRVLKDVVEHGNVEDNGYVIGFSMRFPSAVVSNFVDFNDYVIESLYTPILQIVDKYISQRYNGSYDLNMNVNAMMQGGDEKETGGSIFDITPDHIPNTQEVRKDCVKLYISAYTIIEFYVKTYIINKIDGIEFKMSKLSPFYAFDKEFREQRVKIDTDQMLDKYMELCHRYYDAVIGKTTEERNDKAVEMMIHDLNSMLLFGNDELILRSQVDPRGVDTMLEVKFESMRETIKKSISKIGSKLIRNGKFTNSYIDKYFAGAVAKIESSPAYMKKTLLRKIISELDGESDSSKISDETKAFLDLCIAPIYIVSNAYAQIIEDIVRHIDDLGQGEDFGVQAAQRISIGRAKLLAMIMMSTASLETTQKEFFIGIIDSYYKQCDEVIHNLINFPGMSDESIQKFYTEYHQSFKEGIEQIKQEISAELNGRETVKLVDIKHEFRSLFRDRVNIPTLLDEATIREFNNVIKKYEHGREPVGYVIQEPKWNASYTEFVLTALAYVNPNLAIPYDFVSELMSTRLVDNTVEEIVSATRQSTNAQGIVFIKQALERYNLSTILVAISSIDKNKEKYTITTMNQIMVNKYLAIIPFLMYVLEKISRLFSGNSTYYTYLNRVPIKAYPILKDTIDYPSIIQMRGENPKAVNAKTEISILLDLLKNYYSNLSIYADEHQFGTSIESSNLINHSLSEIRLIVASNKFDICSFLKNIERYEWILPRIISREIINTHKYDRFKLLIEKYNIMTSHPLFKQSINTTLDAIARTLISLLVTKLTFVSFTTESPNNDFAAYHALGEVNINVEEALDGRLFGGDKKENTDTRVGVIFNYICNLLGIPCIDIHQDSSLHAILESVVPATEDVSTMNISVINYIINWLFTGDNGMSLLNAIVKTSPNVMASIRASAIMNEDNNIVLSNLQTTDAEVLKEWYAVEETRLTGYTDVLNLLNPESAKNIFEKFCNIDKLFDEQKFSKGKDETTTGKALRDAYNSAKKSKTSADKLGPYYASMLRESYFCENGYKDELAKPLRHLELGQINTLFREIMWRYKNYIDFEGKYLNYQKVDSSGNDAALIDKHVSSAVAFEKFLEMFEKTIDIRGYYAGVNYLIAAVYSTLEPLLDKAYDSLKDRYIILNGPQYVSLKHDKPNITNYNNTHKSYSTTLFPTNVALMIKKSPTTKLGALVKEYVQSEEVKKFITGMTVNVLNQELKYIYSQINSRTIVNVDYSEAGFSNILEKMTISDIIYAYIILYALYVKKGKNTEKDNMEISNLLNGVESVLNNYEKIVDISMSLSDSSPTIFKNNLTGGGIKFSEDGVVFCVLKQLAEVLESPEGKHKEFTFSNQNIGEKDGSAAMKNKEEMSSIFENMEFSDIDKLLHIGLDKGEIVCENTIDSNINDGYMHIATFKEETLKGNYYTGTKDVKKQIGDKIGGLRFDKHLFAQKTLSYKPLGASGSNDVIVEYYPRLSAIRLLFKQDSPYIYFVNNVIELNGHKLNIGDVLYIYELTMLFNTANYLDTVEENHVSLVLNSVRVIPYDEFRNFVGEYISPVIGGIDTSCAQFLDLCKESVNELFTYQKMTSADGGKLTIPNPTAYGITEMFNRIASYVTDIVRGGKGGKSIGSGKFEATTQFFNNYIGQYNNSIDHTSDISSGAVDTSYAYELVYPTVFDSFVEPSKSLSSDSKAKSGNGKDAPGRHKFSSLILNTIYKYANEGEDTTTVHKFTNEFSVAGTGSIEGDKNSYDKMKEMFGPFKSKKYSEHIGVPLLEIIARSLFTQDPAMVSLKPDTKVAKINVTGGTDQYYAYDASNNDWKDQLFKVRPVYTDGKNGLNVFNYNKKTATEAVTATKDASKTIKSLTGDVTTILSQDSCQQIIIHTAKIALLKWIIMKLHTTIAEKLPAGGDDAAHIMEYINTIFFAEGFNVTNPQMYNNQYLSSDINTFNLGNRVPETRYMKTFGTNKSKMTQSGTTLTHDTLDPADHKTTAEDICPQDLVRNGVFEPLTLANYPGDNANQADHFVCIQRYNGFSASPRFVSKESKGAKTYTRVIDTDDVMSVSIKRDFTDLFETSVSDYYKKNGIITDFVANKGNVDEMGKKGADKRILTEARNHDPYCIGDLQMNNPYITGLKQILNKYIPYICNCTFKEGSFVSHVSAEDEKTIDAEFRNDIENFMQGVWLGYLKRKVYGETIINPEWRPKENLKNTTPAAIAFGVNLLQVNSPQGNVGSTMSLTLPSPIYAREAEDGSGHKNIINIGQISADNFKADTADTYDYVAINNLEDGKQYHIAGYKPAYLFGSANCMNDITLSKSYPSNAYQYHCLKWVNDVWEVAKRGEYDHNSLTSLLQQQITESILNSKSFEKGTEYLPIPDHIREISHDTTIINLYDAINSVPASSRGPILDLVKDIYRGLFGPAFNPAGKPNVSIGTSIIRPHIGQNVQLCALTIDNFTFSALTRQDGSGFNTVYRSDLALARRNTSHKSTASLIEDAFENIFEMDYYSGHDNFKEISSKGDMNVYLYSMVKTRDNTHQFYPTKSEDKSPAKLEPLTLVKGSNLELDQKNKNIALSNIQRLPSVNYNGLKIGKEKWKIYTTPDVYGNQINVYPEAMYIPNTTKAENKGEFNFTKEICRYVADNIASIYSTKRDNSRTDITKYTGVNSNTKDAYKQLFVELEKTVDSLNSHIGSKIDKSTEAYKRDSISYVFNINDKNNNGISECHVASCSMNEPLMNLYTFAKVINHFKDVVHYGNYDELYKAYNTALENSLTKYRLNNVSTYNEFENAFKQEFEREITAIYNNIEPKYKALRYITRFDKAGFKFNNLKTFINVARFTNKTHDTRLNFKEISTGAERQNSDAIRVLPGYKKMLYISPAVAYVKKEQNTPLFDFDSNTKRIDSAAIKRYIDTISEMISSMGTVFSEDYSNEELRTLVAELSLNGAEGTVGSIIKKSAEAAWFGGVKGQRGDSYDLHQAKQLLIGDVWYNRQIKDFITSRLTFNVNLIENRMTMPGKVDDSNSSSVKPQLTAKIQKWCNDFVLFKDIISNHQMEKKAGVVVTKSNENLGIGQAKSDKIGTVKLTDMQSKLVKAYAPIIMYCAIAALPRGNDMSFAAYWNNVLNKIERWSTNQWDVTTGTTNVEELSYFETYRRFYKLGTPVFHLNKIDIGGKSGLTSEQKTLIESSIKTLFNLIDPLKTEITACQSALTNSKDGEAMGKITNIIKYLKQIRSKYYQLINNINSILTHPATKEPAQHELIKIVRQLNIYFSFTHHSLAGLKTDNSSDIGHLIAFDYIQSYPQISSYSVIDTMDKVIQSKNLPDFYLMRKDNKFKLITRLSKDFEQYSKSHPGYSAIDSMIDLLVAIIYNARIDFKFKYGSQPYIIKPFTKSLYRFVDSSSIIRENIKYSQKEALPHEVFNIFLRSVLNTDTIKKASFLNRNRFGTSLASTGIAMQGGDLDESDTINLTNEAYYNNADHTEIEPLIALIDDDHKSRKEAIIAYYDKALLSFNSFFSKNIFAEIIYNSALYHSGMMKIHEELKTRINPADPDAAMLTYWARLIDSRVGEQSSGVFNTTSNIKTIGYAGELESVYGKTIADDAIPASTNNNFYFKQIADKHNQMIPMYQLIKETQGDNIIRSLLKIDSCNTAVGTLIHFLKSFTYRNVDFNANEPYSTSVTSIEPFDYPK